MFLQASQFSAVSLKSTLCFIRNASNTHQTVPRENRLVAIRVRSWFFEIIIRARPLVHHCVHFDRFALLDQQSERKRKQIFFEKRIRILFLFIKWKNWRSLDGDFLQLGHQLELVIGSQCFVWIFVTNCVKQWVNVVTDLIDLLMKFNIGYWNPFQFWSKYKKKTFFLDW